jgi:hypothetical protein
MAEGGFFAGISEAIDKLKKLDDLLLFLGLGMFGWGVVKDRFSADEALISWGLICITLAMAIKLLGQSRGKAFVINQEVSWFRWGT